MGFAFHRSWNCEKRQTGALSAMVFHRQLMVTSGSPVTHPEQRRDPGKRSQEEPRGELTGGILRHSRIGKMEVLFKSEI
jgi:hypothetical protein